MSSLENTPISEHAQNFVAQHLGTCSAAKPTLAHLTAGKNRSTNNDNETQRACNEKIPAKDSNYITRYFWKFGSRGET